MGALFHNLLVFVQLLRAAGVSTDPERTRLCLRAVEQLGLKRRSEFYYAARTTLIYRQGDLAAFDQLFAAFWPRLRAGRLRRLRPPTAVGQTAPRLAGSPGGLRRGRGYSADEVLRRKDFGDMTDAELEQARRLIAALGWRLGERMSRRMQAGPGRSFDYRHSWRANLRYGGEPLLRVYRQRLPKPRPLVVIADVSGSMERYSQLLLHFTYSLFRGLDQPVEAFVFSTRLSRITRQLRLHRAAQAMRAISSAVPDWSGGTRIGAAIKQFNFYWARRTLSHGAIVAVISDGLDRGQVELLKTEIARLRRSCYRLIWLNPLLGSPGYRPLAGGMQAALPYLDGFLPAHNLLSLEQLIAGLLQLSSRRLPAGGMPRAPVELTASATP